MDENYYPEGAAHDPNAPYNQPDDYPIDELALDLAKRNAEELDTGFVEFIEEKMNLDEDNYDENLLIAERYAKDEDTVFDYFKANENHYRECAYEAMSDNEPDPDYYHDLMEDR